MKNLQISGNKSLTLTLTLTLTLISLGFAYIADKSYGLIGAVIAYTFFILISTFQKNLLVCFFLIASSFLSLEFFFIEPIYSFAVNEFESWLMLGAFTVSGLAIVYGKKVSFRSRSEKNLSSRIFIKYFFPVLCLTFIYWFARVFNKPNIEQIIFHFEFSTRLFEELDKHIAVSFFNNVILVSVFSAGIFAIFESKLTAIKSHGFLIPSIKVIVSSGLPVLFLLAAIVVASLNFGIKNYLLYKQSNDFIAENYVSPDELKIASPKQPKNLLLIYVESLEATYRNKDLFGENLLAELDDIKGIQFEDYVQTPGTGWTIAAIVSTQCGVPLKPIALADINLQGKLARKFLPNVTCLGDTLAKSGYTNVFLGGASSDFSGKGKFLKQHGYSKIIGREDWVRDYKYSPKDMNGWGLYDDDLMREAKCELDKLEQTDSPFNLTVLTVDTHFPDGFMSKTCRNAGGKNFTDIVKCSVHQAADLVRYAETKGYLRNTNIVVLGDHLSMTNVVYDKLTSVEHRSIYNKWITNEPFKKNRDSIVHFAVAPTILNSLGFDLDGFKYGLGNSAIIDTKNFQQDKWVRQLMENLDRPSDYYNQFWINEH